MDEGGLSSQFVNFLYAYILSKSEKVPLYVNDVPNAISSSYPILKNTFVNEPNVKYVDTQVLSSVSTKRRQPQIFTLINALQPDALRAFASDLFEWDNSHLDKIQPILSAAPFPSEFDVGVHIHTTRAKPVPIDQYIQAIKKHQQASKRNGLDVFVMSDSQQRLDELQKKCDPTWKIYSLNSPQDFNATSARSRMNAYLHFMAELFLMRNIPHIVCALSSNEGRYIYLTMKNGSTIASVDQPKFSAF
jgi:hypothetical protein